MKIFNLFIWLPWVLVTALELSSRSALAYLLLGMWNLPEPGMEPMSPVFAGKFLTTGPPGKSYRTVFFTF